MAETDFRLLLETDDELAQKLVSSKSFQISRNAVFKVILFQLVESTTAFQSNITQWNELQDFYNKILLYLKKFAIFRSVFVTGVVAIVCKTFPP